MIRGYFASFINGELFSQSKRKSKAVFANLNIGRTSTRNGGAKGAFTKYRTLANNHGDMLAGKALFTKTALTVIISRQAKEERLGHRLMVLG